MLAKMANITVEMMRTVVRIAAIRNFLAVTSIAGFGGNILIAIINQFIIESYLTLFAS